MIFYTNFAVPKQHAACTRGPFIFIRPQHKDDKGLLAHEMEHVAQWWRTFGLHSFLYLFSKRYKLKCEVEAYKVQLLYSPYAHYKFAEFISKNYDLNITEAQALELLK